jgi:SPP1 gp7 family putative phage head morphogenesis protein
MRIDPTRTSALRRKVGAELRRRYMRLRKSLLTMIRDRDALGLKPPDYLIKNSDWKYETSAGKVKRFRAWLRQQMDSTLAGDALIEQWIQESHGRGAGRAFDELRVGTPTTLTDRSGLPLDYQRNEALRRIKTHKATVEKVKLLAGRTFTELDGINAQMSSKMSRLLAEGLVRGWSPTKIANQMSRVVSLSLKQALAITRSELIRAHAEGTLDGMVDQGETRVTAQVEFVTADDERVCSKCRSLEGRVYKIEDARGVIPMHPLCRCVWLPLSKRSQRKLVGNVFCPTGPGGGIDPHCASKGSKSAPVVEVKQIPEITIPNDTLATDVEVGYHGTGGHLIDHIMKEGLKQSEIGTSGPGVYFASLYIEAMMAAMTTASRHKRIQPGDRVVIIEVNASKADKVVTGGSYVGIEEQGKHQIFTRDLSPEEIKKVRIYDAHKIMMMLRTREDAPAKHEFDKFLINSKSIYVAFVIRNNILTNAFCPTGDGGGIDPTCPPHDSRGGSADPSVTPEKKRSEAQVKKDSKGEHGESTDIKPQSSGTDAGGGSTSKEQKATTPETSATPGEKVQASTPNPSTGLPRTFGTGGNKVTPQGALGTPFFHGIDKTLGNMYKGSPHPPPKLNDLADMAGAQPGSKVTARVVEDGKSQSVVPGADKKEIQILVEHGDLGKTMKRRIGKDADGNVFVHNEFIEVWKKGGGTGTDIFGRGVENAKKLGAKYIACHAGKLDASGRHTMNGYTTWPGMGYDESLKSIEGYNKEGAAAIKTKFPHAQSIQDVIDADGGHQWWKDNGFDLYHMKFDLSDGSRSMKKFGAYLEASKKKREGK